MSKNLFLPASTALLFSCLTAFPIQPAEIFAAEAAPAAEVSAAVKEPVVIFTPASQTEIRLNASESVTAKDGSYIQIHAHGKNYPWPGPVWHGKWNLEGCTHVEFDIENLESEEISYAIRIDDAAARQNNANWYTGSITVPGKTRGKFSVPVQAFFPKQLQGKVVGMRGLPGGSKTSAASLDWQNVLAVYVFVSGKDIPSDFRVYSIQGIRGKKSIQPAWMSMTPEEFFPMIDTYGQFKHEDWPGKIHSDAEFAERIAAEKADNAANPKPKCWDRYGGWANGPKLKATGRFRKAKVDGKWWLVTPEGHLFWSHGTDCVGMSNGNGPISDREHYYENLPEKSPFYGQGSTHLGYYGDKGTFRTYNWTQANLLRKYGENFAEIHADLAHERLASWGMNTIGNWSSKDIYKKSRTPYVVTLYANGRKIEGSQGYWGKFPDPFTDEFRKSIQNAVKWNSETLNDSYCVGAFVNNELSWGNEYSLARAALASPADQPAKLEFVKFLQKKYGTIEKLNSAWKTSYADWNAMIQRTDVPKNKELEEDLGTFYSIIAEKYFSVIHEELRAGAPQTLDLGCRFAWTCDRAAYAMAKFVDVMSYNRYEENLTNFKLPEGIDMPVIIGEFHFGALDRGVFHTGLRGAKDQNERAEKYYTYVRSALENPLIVGTHWFQYGAQPTTGRFDGENYQIGLVDLTDSPYPETIAKVREIGNSMYEIRSEKK